MACIWMDGWEIQEPFDSPGLWTSVHAPNNLVDGEVEYDSVRYRTLLGSLRVTNNDIATSHYVYKVLPSTYTQLYGALGLLIDSTVAQVEDANDAIPFFSVVASNGVTQLTMAFGASTNKIMIFRGDVDGGVLLATGSIALVDDEWTHIQWRYAIDNVAGLVQVKVNGVVDINLSGANTKTSGIDISSIKLGVLGGTAGLNFDDFVINDTTGAVSNGWPGNAVVQLIYPNGAGNYSDWTSTDATIYDAIDDLFAHGFIDGDTTAISGIDIGDRASAALNNPTVNGPIQAVMLISSARNDQPGDDQMAQFVRISAVDYDSPAFVPNYNAYKWHTDILTLNPATSGQWLAAEVDALELGWVVA